MSKSLEFEGKITVEFGSDEYKELLDAYDNNSLTYIKTEHYSGPAYVVEMEHTSNGSDFNVVFTSQFAHPPFLQF